MSLPPLAAKVIAMKNVIGAIIIIGGIIVSAAGMLKVPAQQQAIAQKLDDNNRTMVTVHDETNRKLDVLICLQAHLETPIKCVTKK